MQEACWPGGGGGRHRCGGAAAAADATRHGPVAAWFRPCPHVQSLRRRLAARPPHDAFLYGRPARLPAGHGPRRAVPTAAWAAARDLWDQPTTFVNTIDPASFRLFHRSSYGHRNRRTFVVVVYDPSLPACQDVEFQVERLATGLSHEPSVCVSKLDASGSDAGAFVSHHLGIRQLPTVLLYPQGAPGYMRYKGQHITAEALLASINQAHALTTPSQEPMELIGAPELGVLEAEGAAMGAAVAAGVDGRTGTGAGAAPGGRAGPVHGGGQQQAALQRQQEWQPPKERRSYWTGDKVAFWSTILALGVLSYGWERWASDWWFSRGLRQRLEKRGRGEQFDVEQNVEDFLFMLTRKDARLVPKDGPPQQGQGQQGQQVPGALDGGNAGWQQLQQQQPQLGMGLAEGQPQGRTDPLPGQRTAGERDGGVGPGRTAGSGTLKGGAG